MMQKNSGCLWMLAGFGLCLGFLFVLGIVFTASMRQHDTPWSKPSAPKFEEAIVVDAKPFKDAAGKEVKDTDAKIAVIYLRGIITSAEPGSLGETMVDDLKLQLEQAATDDKVKAIVLYIDSPGGEVTASDIHLQRRAQSARRRLRREEAGRRLHGLARGVRRLLRRLRRQLAHGQ